MTQSLWEILSNMLTLLACDIAFLALFIIALIPLSMYKHAAFAVLRRNFIGYFNNPTGYIFLCVFVVLTSLAAFWPYEFFNSNLANLDQLNQYIPLILLVFIPAITMSIWAEERRQGTDELLLTIPADDLSIVLGKYLAAVAIFTASLLFSQISTYLVLVFLSLGEVDTGLFFATYLGYWLLGLAMLAIGMVASFLTNNLTVGFVLGGLLNAPLAAASYADVVVGNNTVARFVEKWSFGQQFEDLGRGVISLSSLVYFILIAVVGVYLCIVLIGRRHWLSGRDGTAMFFHFTLRVVALVFIALGANALFTQFDVRQDVTRGRISSLSPDTKQVLRKIESKYPIKVEAFISADVPEQYAQTKKDLISKLKELKSRAGTMIDLTIYDNLELSSEEAIMAEERYGITPSDVQVIARGAPRNEQILMGVAFTSGLEKVVIPFFDYGIPIEYELIRSIATVGQAERMKIGIVQTDAQLFGGFSFAGGQPRQTPKQPIVEELEKQYEVEQVDPSNPIDVEKYRALLIVQPSSLAPQQFENLMTAIRSGIPSAVFEDPLPTFMQGVPGTDQPKQSQGMMGGRPPEKADIQPLLDLLGIQLLSDRDQVSGQERTQIVWQRYNPYPKLQSNGLPAEWVFVREEAPGASDPQSDDIFAFNPNLKITSGLKEVLMPAPGGIKQSGDTPGLQFQPLVVTGDQSGTVSLNAVRQNQGNLIEMEKARGSSVEGRRFTLAAWIKAKEKEGDQQQEESEGEENSEESTPAEDRSLNVIFVADIDLLAPFFSQLRARPPDFVSLRFDNVTLVLNILDALAGDDSFLDIRKRKVRHSTLRMVENQTEAARASVDQQEAQYQQEYDDALKQARADMEEQFASVQKRLDAIRQQQQRGEQIDLDEVRRLQQELQIKQGRAQRRFEVKQEQLRREQQRDLKRISQELEQNVRRIQNGYKRNAILWPVIPPLLIGLVVFVRRRLREREGISRARLK